MYHKTLLPLAILLISPLVRAQTATQLPEDALALQSSYYEACEKVLKPLKDKYKAELERLLQVHTDAGRLNEVLAIQNEIATIYPIQASTSEAPPPELKGIRAKRLFSKLSGTSWSTTNWDDAIITLEPDGKVKFSNEKHIVRWFISNNGELMLQDRDAPPHEAKLNAKEDSFTIFFGSPKVCTLLPEAP